MSHLVPELWARRLGKMALILLTVQNETKILFLYKKTKHLPIFSQPLQAGASFHCPLLLYDGLLASLALGILSLTKLII